MNPFKGKDIISCKDFSRDDLLYLFEKAKLIEHMLNVKGKVDLLRGKVLATLFFEPSTRTRLSFETAMRRLNGDVIGFTSEEATSVAKGESFEDTIRTVSQYADVIVVRHKRPGSAKIAAEVSDVPVINAGDGSNEHPTQAFLDIYTILKEKGSIDGLNIALVGDLKHARTMHSLAYALSNFKVKLYLVSPEVLRMPKEITDYLKEKGIEFHEVDELSSVISDIDVLYTVRVQKERFPSIEEYEKVKGSYIVTPKLLDKAKSDLIILHPLPRTIELPTEIDKLPYAKYFNQVKNGVYVRAALLALIFDAL
ncbi:MAG TPA: aspartate carbamoyltransferase [Acidilobales archaeon]|nr:MAG: aspartate carbamoyltransferase [Thermoprotei archaeon]HDD26885.1 aspartate carbamoyltransferase [Acidilobales archaeon]